MCECHTCSAGAAASPLRRCRRRLSILSCWQYPYTYTRMVGGHPLATRVARRVMRHATHLHPRHEGEREQRAGCGAATSHAPELSNLVGLVCLAVIGRGSAARLGSGDQSQFGSAPACPPAHSSRPCRKPDHLEPESPVTPFLPRAGCCAFGQLRGWLRTIMPASSVTLRTFLLDQDVAAGLAAAAAAAANLRYAMCRNSTRCQGANGRSSALRQGWVKMASFAQRPSPPPARCLQSKIKTSAGPIPLRHPASRRRYRRELPVIAGRHGHHGFRQPITVGRERRASRVCAMSRRPSVDGPPFVVAPRGWACGGLAVLAAADHLYQTARRAVTLLSLFSRGTPRPWRSTRRPSQPGGGWR